MSSGERKSFIRDTVLSVQSRIAEFQSLHPDTTMTFDFPHFTTSLECLALLGAVFYFTQDRKNDQNRVWESEKAVRYVMNQCYKNQYQGEWLQIQKVLENADNFEDFYSYIIANVMNEHDYYGNLEVRIFRVALTLACKAEGSQYGKVRKPIRRRGYKDKGTLRPDWQKRNVALLNDDRVDLRYRIKHPLIYEEEFQTQGNLRLANTLKRLKGDEEDDFCKFFANSV